jgi:hypothetical protein
MRINWGNYSGPYVLSTKYISKNKPMQMMMKETKVIKNALCR